LSPYTFSLNFHNCETHHIHPFPYAQISLSLINGRKRMKLDHETYSHNTIPMASKILSWEKLLLLFWFERCQQQVWVSSSISYLQIARSVLLWILWQPKCGSSIERSKFHYEPNMTNKSFNHAFIQKTRQKYAGNYSFKKRLTPSRVNSIFEILIFSFTFRQNFTSKKAASDLLYMLPSLDPALLSSHDFLLVWYGSCIRQFRVWSPIVSWFVTPFDIKSKRISRSQPLPPSLCKPESKKIP